MDIVSRVKNILTTPQTEWPVIASEPGEPQQIYTNHVIILAAIPAIAQLIGLLILLRFFAVGSVIVLAILTFVVMALAPAIVAFIMAKLGPQLGAPDDLNGALKLVAYSFTPYWIAGAAYILVFIITGLVWIIVLLGAAYGLYLLWLGTPVIMRTTPDKTPVYVGATAVVTIVVVGVLQYIAQRVAFGF
jgi:hypothetical protein